jgi:hypothetical protein
VALPQLNIPITSNFLDETLANGRVPLAKIKRDGNAMDGDFF